MQHISTTPFGRRTVTPDLMAARHLAQAPIPDARPDKWTLLRDLTTARQQFGITDRDLTVLAALISFHPHDDLGEGDTTVVFPSNAKLSARAHGMAESTLRRHLAALVKARLILRHDSPNGKRYARAERDGGIACAFGFDLRPLLTRSPEITQAAEVARAQAAKLRQMREALVLHLRDAAKLIDYGRALPSSSDADWPEVFDQLCALQKQTRRKPTLDGLQQALADVARLLAVIKTHIAAVETSPDNLPETASETEQPGGNDSQNERHKQDSNIIPFESEQRGETGMPPGTRPEKSPTAPEAPPAPDDGLKLPLHLIVKACPELRSFLSSEIESWQDLIAAALFLRPMMGIADEVWQDAMQAMGPQAAAVTLAAMLERAQSIRNPGGYLRSLTQKARNEGFSPAPMIMALLTAANRTPV